jgi:hypothetical protein
MKDEARVGERMHYIVALEQVVMDSSGDWYEDDLALLQRQPLDFPRLLYVLLQGHRPDVKIWHNHITESVTVVLDGEEATITVPPIDSRDMLLIYTNQLVKDILE